MERVVVDGYNVIHAWSSLKKLMTDASLEAARDKLIDRLSVLGMIAGAEVTVVFDAHHSAARSNSESLVEGVHVLFTRKGHSADHAIERIAYAASQVDDIITVATSDRFQRDLVRGMGGAVISAEELERRVLDAEEEMGRRIQRYSK
ncbi:MAG TPA: NYN domain-containing protein [Candidatus Dormibacteraeota bacterium]|nr:NYN domain-containing protein [Candidatus Dormibacteraeota bacterium]